MARKAALDYIPIPTWEVALNDQSQRWYGEVVPLADDEKIIEHDNCQIENSCTNDEDVIAREDKSTVKKLVTTELVTMVEELLDDILKTPLHNSHSGIRSVVYIVSVAGYDGLTTEKRH